MACSIVGSPVSGLSVHATRSLTFLTAMTPVKCRLFFVLLVVAAALGMAPPSKSSRREKYEMAKRSVVARNLQLDDSSDDGGNDDDDASSSSSKSLYNCGDPGTQSNGLAPPASVQADFMHVVNKIGSTHGCFDASNAQGACQNQEWNLLCSCAITDAPGALAQS